MLWQLLIFTVGLGLLYLGAEWLVRGAASLALDYGLRRLVVGITVVALGTSMPEFVTNFFAALSGEDSLALGNIVGSNICNIALILGASALILPLGVTPGTLRKEYPIMMAVMVLFYLLSLDGVIGRIDGILLVFGLISFMVFVVIDCKRHARSTDAASEPQSKANAPANSIGKKTVLVIGGIIFLAGGARLMIDAAVNIANALGVDHVVIGLTVVAVGTSLPELAASIVSAWKRDPDMSVGNVLGSNLLNVLFVVGLVALFRPLQVEPVALTIHFPVMLGFGILLLPLAWTSFRITRLEGGVLVAAFTSYLLYLVLPYM